MSLSLNLVTALRGRAGTVISVYSRHSLVTPWKYSPWNSPGQNTGAGSLSLLQGIFPTQGLNPGLPRCRWILYQLSHKGSPRILEWVAYPFSSKSSQPRNRTRVSCIAGGFFFFFFFFYLWWILSYIEMTQLWVYMCSPSRSPLPPPSPPDPSRSSQCTRFERLSHASNLGW